MVLITSHRRENFGNGMRNICQALNILASHFPDTDFVYPIHLNPNIRKSVHDIIDNNLNNIHLLEPMDYFGFIGMMQRCTLVLTDSGGLQEEAPAFGKPVLVMRDTTERPEAVTAGTARLVGTDRKCIETAVAELLTNTNAYQAMANAVNPFGDGHAAKRIANHLARDRGLRASPSFCIGSITF